MASAMAMAILISSSSSSVVFAEFSSKGAGVNASALEAPFTAGAASYTSELLSVLSAIEDANILGAVAARERL